MNFERIPDNHDAFSELITDIRSDVLEKAKEKYGEDEGTAWFFERQVEYSQMLKAVHVENPQDSVAYHILIGSGIPKGLDTGKMIPDFPGEISVRAFLEGLLKELKTS